MATTTAQLLTMMSTIPVLYIAVLLITAVFALPMGLFYYLYKKI